MEPDRRNEKIARAVREAGTVDRGLTQNAARVLERRYLSKDRQGRVQEDPEGMFRRVAGNLSQAELNYGEAREKRRRMVEEEFYTVMSRLDFLPNSPTLMNAGRELQQLSACFVLPVEDSLNGIFGTVKQTALIHKSGGGTGFSFTRLRPAGDLVGSTGGVASGPVSFIGAFDAATEVVKQGSTRRGANMAILNVDHPDILEFIRAKRDPGRLLNFNISVGITEDFMERWRREEEYDLINPRTGERTGSLNTRDVLSQIVDSAWATGDPGLVFLDRINEGNPNPQLGRIESTNPCVTGDTLVMTREGPRRADSLVGHPQELLVDGAVYQTGPQGFFSTGKKPVVTVRTGSGRSLTLTPDHPVARAHWEPYGSEPRRTWAPAGEIAAGDLLSLHDHREAHLREDEAQHQSNTRDALEEAFRNENIVIDPRENDPGMYLRGLDQETARTAQAHLAHLGIQSKVRVTAGSNETELELRGENVAAFAIRGSRHEGAERFYLRQLAGMVRQARPEGIHRRGLVDQVESVEPAGEAEVYDVQVPGINAFDANGFYVHNCGEEPLLPYESCNLGSVNLARMLRVNDKGEMEVDWNRLSQVITTGVRMLDNVIDMNQFPIEEIGEMSRLTRRIGLGVMGWADLLVQLGIRYDSEEALELARELMGFIQRETHRASAELAEERGTFPAWEGSVYQTPMRNSAPVTIAPTGTISIIAGASSGIEPLFALSYVRNVMDSTRLVEVNPYFEAIARQEGFYTPELMEQVAETGSLEGLEAPDWVKDVFRVSRDIRHTWHVLMQAAFQAHTDNAVSKTINMPAEATPGGRAGSLPPRLHTELQGHHGLPGREQGRPGAEHRRRRPGEGRRGDTDPPEPPQGDAGSDGAVPHRARQHVHHRQLRRGRQGLRDLRRPGQGRGVRLRQPGGGEPDGIAMSPSRGGPGGDHLQPTGHHLLPRVGRGSADNLGPRRHGQHAATVGRPGQLQQQAAPAAAAGAGRLQRGATGHRPPQVPRLQLQGGVPRGLRGLLQPCMRLEQVLLSRGCRKPAVQGDEARDCQPTEQ